MKSIVLHANEVRQLKDAGEVVVVREFKHQITSSYQPKLYGVAQWGEHKGKYGVEFHDGAHEAKFFPFPWQLGEVYYVREAWRGFKNERGSIAQYKLDANPDEWADSNLGKWKSPATMPQWASRFSVLCTSAKLVQNGDKWEWCGVFKIK